MCHYHQLRLKVLPVLLLLAVGGLRAAADVATLPSLISPLGIDAVAVVPGAERGEVEIALREGVTRWKALEFQAWLTRYRVAFGTGNLAANESMFLDLVHAPRPLGVSQAALEILRNSAKYRHVVSLRKMYGTDMAELRVRWADGNLKFDQFRDSFSVLTFGQPFDENSSDDKIRINAVVSKMRAGLSLEKAMEHVPSEFGDFIKAEMRTVKPEWVVEMDDIHSLRLGETHVPEEVRFLNQTFVRFDLLAHLPALASATVAERLLLAIYPELYPAFAQLRRFSVRLGDLNLNEIDGYRGAIETGTTYRFRDYYFPLLVNVSRLEEGTQLRLEIALNVNEMLYDDEGESPAFDELRKRFMARWSRFAERLGLPPALRKLKTQTNEYGQLGLIFKGPKQALTAIQFAADLEYDFDCPALLAGRDRTGLPGQEAPIDREVGAGHE